jgi:uncharacterized protein YebE (UPF0316 family)
MVEFLGNLKDFLTGDSIWVYLMIFFGKIVEVTVSTLRIVMINRGERGKGAFVAFFEITLWLFITGTVLSGITDHLDLWRVLVLGVAFSLGNYFGSWLEGKLAFGLSSIQIIIPCDVSCTTLVGELREAGFAVTVLEGQGKDGAREVLILHMKRKRIPAAIAIVKSRLKNAMITVNDVRVANGGFIKK